MAGMSTYKIHYMEPLQMMQKCVLHTSRHFLCSNLYYRHACASDRNKCELDTQTHDKKGINVDQEESHTFLGDLH